MFFNKSKPKKVIFLDVDGVLNSDTTERYTKFTHSKFIEKEYVCRVKQIIDATNASVVLSSDWKLDEETRKDPAYNGDLLELITELKKYNIEIWNFTPNVGSTRGDEIQKFLNEHKYIRNFVILDDRIDMAPNLPHLVRTNSRFGLLDEDKDKAIQILNNYLAGLDAKKISKLKSLTEGVRFFRQRH